MPATRSSQNRAAFALLMATIGWGAGFTWAKVGGRTINANVGQGVGGAVGPIALLAVRFITAGLVWMIIFPQARRGWSLASVGRAAIIGLFLALGAAVQHLGLDFTSAAISAFLTSLTIVFVPLFSTLVLRKVPSVTTILAVIIAVVGVFVMTGAGRITSLGIGEWLGLACAASYSIYILVVNAVVPHDNPFRMTGGQFLVTGLLLLPLVPILTPANQSVWHAFSLRDVWLNGALLVIFPTLISYGLLTHFQPRLDATRAALIYLLEPIFASIYAWKFGHEPMASQEMIGALIILVANAMIEMIEAMKQRSVRAGIAPREPV